MTDSIRVVSKQLQLKKFKELRKRGGSAATTSSLQEDDASQKVPATRKKRPLPDNIQDTLSRIESQQQAQQNIITNLYRILATQLRSPTNSITSTPVSSPLPSSRAVSPSSIFGQQPNTPSAITALSDENATPRNKRRRVENSQEADSVEETHNHPWQNFENHLLGLVQCYQTLDPSLRSQTLRSLVRTLPAHQIGPLVELLSILRDEGLAQAGTSCSSVQCQCQFLSLPASPNPFDATMPVGMGMNEDEENCSTKTSHATSPMSPGQGDILENLETGGFYKELFACQDWLSESATI